MTNYMVTPRKANSLVPPISPNFKNRTNIICGVTNRVGRVPLTLATTVRRKHIHSVIDWPSVHWSPLLKVVMTVSLDITINLRFSDPFSPKTQLAIPLALGECNDCPTAWGPPALATLTTRFIRRLYSLQINS